MNFVYPNTMSSFAQQAFYTSAMTNNQWLLQQPKDSGYASDDHDLFEKTFESQLPSIPQVSSHHMSQQTPMSAFSDSSCSESSSNGGHSSPFEYAESLCTPSTNYNAHWNPYESLDTSVKKLSIDAGITSMTGYCDIDSMLTAAYHNTSASQPKRFSAFSQSSPRSSTSNQQSLQQQECLVEAPASPALGRPKGSRVPHQAVEQRYRANLQDNFDRLRNVLPEIATVQPARSGQPPKPSKAEVLAAAAEYIRQLEEENDMLRENVMDAAVGELRRKRAKTG